MMNASQVPTRSPAPSGADDSLFELVEQLTDRLQRGEPVDLGAYAADYPHYAEQLQMLLPALHAVEEISRKDSALTEREVFNQALGDFRIIRELGRGGMGIVYEAEQLSIGRRVALKVLPFAAVVARNALQRFRNEIRAAGTLDHPHIVGVYSVGEERGVNYYAMQLVRGRSLAEVIHRMRSAECGMRNGRDGTGVREQGTEVRGQKSEVSYQETGDKGQGTGISELDQSQIDTVAAALSTEHSNDPQRYFRRVAELGVQAAEALEHAHEQGIVHRDIKPGNLLLDARGNVYVTDFGLARLDSDASMTRSGDLLGTLRYMSPEAAVGGSRRVIDARTDIYSLGATLYELLAVQPAFLGSNRHELLGRISDEEPIPLQRLRPGLPDELQTIVMKAMAKEPAERYATAQDLADDLRRFGEGRPIHARRVTWMQRVARRARRHRAWVWSGVVVLMIATLLLAGAMLWVWREQQETRRALAMVEQQRLVAERSVVRAEANFRQARRTVDRYFTTVSESTLLDEPGLQPLRRELLETALEYYQALAEQRSNDPLLQAEVASGILRAAQIHYALDEYDQFIDYMQRAARRMEPLLEGAAAPSGLAKALGPVFIGGRCFHYATRPPSRPQYAKRTLQRVVRIWKWLVQEYPGSATIRNDLAGFSIYLGDLYGTLGERQRAARTFREARDLWQELTQEAPQSLEIRSNLASSHEYLAKVLRSVNREGEKADALRAAYRLRTDLVAEAPTNPEYRRELVGICQRLARLRLTKPRAAKQFHRHAYDVIRKLVREFPDTPAYRESLAISLAGMGSVARLAGRIDEADAYYHEALATVEDLTNEYPDRFQYRERLAALSEDVALHLLRMDRRKKAEHAYRRAVELRLALLEHYNRRPGRLAQAAWLMIIWPDSRWADPERSLELVAEALEKSPDSVNLWKVRGAANYRSGNWKAARGDLEHWLELAPGRGNGWFFLAMTHEQLGNRDEARHWFDKAVAWMEKYAPDGGRLHLLRAEAADLLGFSER